MDSIITDCSQSLGGKNVDLMRRLNDLVGEIDFNKQLIFFIAQLIRLHKHCTSDHSDILCYTECMLVGISKIYEKITVAFRCRDKVNLFEHMKEGITKLQGNGILAHEMYSTVRAVKSKKNYFIDSSVIIS
ncbi:hypothetical protein RF11_06896 [Thelohanellus kitauei]|uniref:Uncharacterized protein n=1 Tax=Thelohanellus kitauei TaxID=669202 RepID=A0A0C2IXQ0_THEKT|nr:hypothetical protein RF11_06896 [Thelohanellus kitauei]